MPGCIIVDVTYVKMKTMLSIIMVNENYQNNNNNNNNNKGCYFDNINNNNNNNELVVLSNSLHLLPGLC